MKLTIRSKLHKSQEVHIKLNKENKEYIKSKVVSSKNYDIANMNGLNDKLK